MISLFDLFSLNIEEIKLKLVRYNSSKSKEELLLDLIDRYNRGGLLDSYGAAIVNNDLFAKYIFEPKEILQQELSDAGLISLEYSNDIPTLVLVIVLVVAHLKDDNLWFYVIKELNDDVVVSLVTSKIMTQDLFDFIYSFYKNLLLEGQLRD